MAVLSMLDWTSGSISESSSRSWSTDDRLPRSPETSRFPCFGRLGEGTSYEVKGKPAEPTSMPSGPSIL